jgi:sarcosine oxidase subunit beta
VQAVVTDRGKISCSHVVNAAGGYGRDISLMVGTDLPVYPDSHEAGVTEPVQRFFLPMIVDIVPDEQSDNYYFYQNAENQIVFCITPRPKRLGTDRRSTSEFLPMVIPRMLQSLSPPAQSQSAENLAGSLSHDPRRQTHRRL